MSLIMPAAIFTFSALPAAALGDVVAFEGGDFPEDTEPAWQRFGTFDAERWISNGWFYQNVDLGDWAPPPGGEQDGYERSLGDFIGENEFFIEWRMETDGENSEIPGVAPAALVATGTTGVN